MHISDILHSSCIDLNASANSKEDVINKAVKLVAKAQCLSDVAAFEQDVLAREQECSTGLGNEIGIPHAKSSYVKQAAISAMVLKPSVDFDALDGLKVKLVFLIASPLHASDEHLDVLARLSTLLVDDKFKQSLINAQSEQEFLNIIDKAENKEIIADELAHISHKNDEHNGIFYDLVAVTACPAGLSHTYMAAEALENKAKQMGLSIKVEADGASGNRNPLMPEDIANAKAVIVAADRAVDLDRFTGKPMVRSGVVEGVRNPGKLIEQALREDCEIYEGEGEIYKTNLLMKSYRHLMSGLTYILPLVATAGIMAALSHMTLIAHSGAGEFFSNLSQLLCNLIVPVFSAFIAFSIAGRMALVAGFTGGIMASIGAAGILGAMVNGFAGGIISFYIARSSQRLVFGLDATLALICYPLFSSALTGLFAQFISNDAIAYLSSEIFFLLNVALGYELLIIGAILGLMISSDMGGPFNKIAYAFAVLMLADGLEDGIYLSPLMATVMVAGMVPPLAMGIAALIFGHYFSNKERVLAPKAILSGCLFITEGALPYLKLHPIFSRSAMMLGSALAGALCMWLDVAVPAPHGGILILPFSNNIEHFALALALGVGLTMILVLTQRLIMSKQEKYQRLHQEQED